MGAEHDTCVCMRACMCVMHDVYLWARVLSILRIWRAEDSFVH